VPNEVPRTNHPDLWTDQEGGQMFEGIDRSIETRCPRCDQCPVFKGRLMPGSAIEMKCPRCRQRVVLVVPIGVGDEEAPN